MRPRRGRASREGGVDCQREPAPPPKTGPATAPSIRRGGDRCRRIAPRKAKQRPRTDAVDLVGRMKDNTLPKAKRRQISNIDPLERLKKDRAPRRRGEPPTGHGPQPTPRLRRGGRASARNIARGPVCPPSAKPSGVLPPSAWISAQGPAGSGAGQMVETFSLQKSYAPCEECLRRR